MASMGAFFGQLSRVNVFPLLRDHLLFMRSGRTGRPALLMRGLVILVGPAAGLASFGFGLSMPSVGDLVGALGLLAGVFLSAFAIVFGVRSSMRRDPSRALEIKSTRLVDESAITLLAAALWSGVDAIWLAVLSAAQPDGTVLTPFATAVTVGLSAIVVTYFLLSVRRLHVLYTDTFPPFWRVKDMVEGKAGSAPVAEPEPARKD